MIATLGTRDLRRVHLADELGVVGHGREIERSAQARLAGRVALGIEGRKRKVAALGEDVGAARIFPGPGEDGIRGIRGVDVGLAEPGLPVNVEARTGLALLGARPCAGHHEGFGWSRRRGGSRRHGVAARVAAAQEPAERGGEGHRRNSGRRSRKPPRQPADRGLDSRLHRKPPQTSAMWSSAAASARARPTQARGPR